MKVEFKVDDVVMDHLVAAQLKEHVEMLSDFIDDLEDNDYMTEIQDEDWHDTMKYLRALKKVYYYFTGEKL